MQLTTGKQILRGVVAVWAAALLFTPSVDVRAAEIEDVEFADQLEVEGQTLRLHGLGLLRYRIVFRAYVAGLYLADSKDAARVLADVPKRLELEYFWGIAGKDFGEAADQILQQNFSSEKLEPLRARIGELHRLYRDVEPGDRYALTYLPGRGTELAHNGRPLGTIPGADFAAAYFAIWLGREPIDGDFRDRLLSGRRD